MRPASDGVGGTGHHSPTATTAADELRRPSRNPVTWLLVALVDLYRATAPLRQPRCRFHPTCSAYARGSLRAHGPLRGSWLAVRRLLRCHPWNPGGVDHVPPPSTRASKVATR